MKNKQQSKSRTFINSNANPIGVFDSGVGGLTVIKELIKVLPNEDIIYFGDTARVPYGTKSKDSVVRFSKEIVGFLTEKNVKLILVACNTASAVALNILRKEVKIPVVGVIESGVTAALSSSSRKKIGVIGTEATIRSGAYEKAIRKAAGNCKVINRACPLFVPLVEEGWVDKKVNKIVAGEYLKFMKKSGVDTVILGCTHYPLLKNVIGKILGKKIKLVDSGVEVARNVKKILENKKLLNNRKRFGYRKFFVSDAPAKFKKLGRIFLRRKILVVSKVNVEERYV
ncbi:MAG: glutamate racemase [Elusimicrobia bacterium]|nr:glutamate racemase [Elusimicrobiota bacterium]